MSPAKDQKSCGAGWAYATASAVEAKWYMLTNTSLIISSQQLVDCVPKTDPPRGCESVLDLLAVANYITEPD